MDDKRTDESIRDILRRLRLDADRDRWQQNLQQITPSDVEAALASRPGSYSLDKLAALVSPAAEDYLEEMAQMSRRLTIQRFGRTIRLFAPLYVSSYCVNRCRYCGFNTDNTFTRARLTIEEALAEAEILASEGFRDILLVSSEDKRFISTAYLEGLAGELRRRFSFVGVEIYQMTTSEYQRLFDAGVEGVTLYQETYDRGAYAHYHLAGPKADYEMRLRGPDDMGAAGMREIGLGVLLGLADWRAEAVTYLVFISSVAAGVRCLRSGIPPSAHGQEPRADDVGAAIVLCRRGDRDFDTRAGGAEGQPCRTRRDTHECGQPDQSRRIFRA